jgi:6-phospho-beta-glucosidase
VDRAVVTIVGGGAFAPKLCAALARAALPPLEVRLVAQDPRRLQLVATHAARAPAAEGRDLRVTATTSLAAAVAGASAVILLVRVGGLAARAHDEAFPRRFGLAGDEGLGVGGIANAYRTLPVLTDLAAPLRAHAPRAPVLNLVAPLGVTTRLLLDEGIEAIGVCELPGVTLEALAAGGAIEARYAGLNHLGWFWDIRSGSGDALARAAAAGLVDAEVLARFGAAPLHYYYDVFDPAAGQRLGRARAPDRARLLLALSDRIFARLAASPGGPVPELEERPTPWFEQAIVPLLESRLAGVPWRGFASVRNGDLVPVLSHQMVVEVAITAEGDRVRPVPPGELPAPVAGFLSAVARAEELSYRAARARATALVAEAIGALPLPIAPADIPALTRLACGPVPGER